MGEGEGFHSRRPLPNVEGVATREAPHQSSSNPVRPQATSSDYYGEPNPGEKDFMFILNWDIVKGSHFTDSGVCVTFVNQCVPPRERIHQRGRYRRDLHMDYSSSLANPMACG